ncbi:unnamed protein product [Parnassius mnemosyne]|uniref:Mitochondrial carrier protein n=1 Tax=Parnassius mnemosyne TaxID=213953 RepID=A0AAV1KZE1_9NEOP
MVGYQRNDSLTHNQKFIAGCVTGMIARLITQPLDIVKLRMQLQQKSGDGRSINISEIIRKISQEEGLKAFFHGHYIGQIHSTLSVLAQFFVYELATKQVANSGIDEKHLPTMEFFCGIFAGCCSATVASPLEVIRVRQMIVKEQYKGLLNGAKEVYNTGGVLAFFEGLSASLIQLGPAVGLSFSVFRWLQPFILRHLSDDNDNGEHSQNIAHKPAHIVIASMVAGSAAGFVSKTATYPFDLVKRRLQIGTHKQDSRYSTPSTSQHLIRCNKFLACIYNTIKKDGIRGLYQGWKITVLKSQLTSIVAFTTYEVTCHCIREYNAR